MTQAARLHHLLRAFNAHDLDRIRRKDSYWKLVG
jgi:hypothetical protein